MQTKHTPGPWSVEIDHAAEEPEFIRANRDGEMLDIASVLVDETGSAKANARLIAAAPDLLASLQGIMAGVAGCQKEPQYEAARAAINRATGA